MHRFMKSYSELLSITFFLFPVLLFMNLVSHGLGLLVAFCGILYVYKYVGGHWISPDFSFVWKDLNFYLGVAAFCYVFFLALLALPKFL